jgi:hypothetical protein
VSKEGRKNLNRGKGEFYYIESLLNSNSKMREWSRVGAEKDFAGVEYLSIRDAPLFEGMECNSSWTSYKSFRNICITGYTTIRPLPTYPPPSQKLYLKLPQSTPHSYLQKPANMGNLKRPYPPEVTASESEQLLSTIKDWSVAHGLTVRPPLSLVSADADPHGVLATTAPVTLFPSPFPRVCFEQAKSIQSAYNQLYASISQDEEFLKDIIQEYVRPSSRYCFRLSSSPRFCLNDAIRTGS